MLLRIIAGLVFFIMAVFAIIGVVTTLLVMMMIQDEREMESIRDNNKSSE